jgi:poly-gamma-glutamate capsule biosynthesis protein CapA/YwtB (metallophosphatase superfamily)
MSGDEVVSLAVSGDVMLGRGVDQILPAPSDPALRESYIADARSYVALAERAHGPVPSPVDPTWPWGDALTAVDEVAPDVRLLNLETSITRSDDFAPGKAVHYRMNPANVASLTTARPDVCTLANNHVLDFGVAGLLETLDVLAGAGLATAGAGPDADAAWTPAVVPLPNGARMLVLAVGTPSSGIPAGWAATRTRPGIALVTEATGTAAAEVVDRLREHRRPGDLLVVSIHWGSNWGYDIGADQRRFAHALVEGGVHLVHGHSSHHPRPLEVHRGRLVLYGCGDLINDYEGIAGHGGYRDDLRLLYLVSLHAHSGELADLRMIPLRARRLRLEHASAADAAWLAGVLDRTSRRLGVRVVAGADGRLALGAS